MYMCRILFFNVFTSSRGKLLAFLRQSLSQAGYKCEKLAQLLQRVGIAKAANVREVRLG